MNPGTLGSNLPAPAVCTNCRGEMDPTATIGLDAPISDGLKESPEGKLVQAALRLVGRQRTHPLCTECFYDGAYNVTDHHKVWREIATNESGEQAALTCGHHVNTVSREGWLICRTCTTEGRGRLLDILHD